MMITMWLPANQQVTFYILRLAELKVTQVTTGQFLVERLQLQGAWCDEPKFTPKRDHMHEQGIENAIELQRGHSLKPVRIQK